MARSINRGYDKPHSGGDRAGFSPASLFSRHHSGGHPKANKNQGTVLHKVATLAPARALSQSISLDLSAAQEKKP